MVRHGPGCQFSAVAAHVDRSSTPIARHLWKAYLALALAPLGVYYALAVVPQAVVYDGLSLAAGLALLLGIRLHHPRPRLPWLLLAAGQLCFFGGDVSWDLLSLVLHQSPFPSFADGAYLAGYPLIALGLGILVTRGRGRLDWRVLADAGIVTTGLALIVWVGLVDPLITDPTLSPLERVVSVAYPLGDILLLTVLVRLLIGPATVTPALRLIAASLVASLVGDALFGYLSLDHASAPVVDAVFLAGYACWGAAGLHPSIAGPAQPLPVAPPRLSGRRLAALTAATLFGPIILLWEGMTGVPIDFWPVALGCALTSVLVLARVGGLVRELTSALGAQQALEDELRHQAFHDPLTNLPNRALLTDRLAHALTRREGRVALLFLDVDEFKAINDTFGHGAGDAVLVAIGERLRACLRAADTAARMGGDEYAVLVEDIADEHEPVVIAERLLDALRAPFTVGGAERVVRVSLGIATALAGEEQPEEVLRSADQAMYRAKVRGGGLELSVPERLVGAHVAQPARDATRPAISAAIPQARPRPVA